jgi:hypothetical protein
MRGRLRAAFSLERPVGFAGPSITDLRTTNTDQALDDSPNHPKFDLLGRLDMLTHMGAFNNC